jgi:hypothetical protein
MHEPDAELLAAAMRSFQIAFRRREMGTTTCLSRKERVMSTLEPDGPTPEEPMPPEPGTMPEQEPGTAPEAPTMPEDPDIESPPTQPDQSRL